MRFEKITDTKIKIFFSYDDMNKNHISKKVLFSNNHFSQNFIQSILETAEQNLNFKIEDENILIEILNYNDGCILLQKSLLILLEISKVQFFINLIILKIL